MLQVKQAFGSCNLQNAVKAWKNWKECDAQRASLQLEEAMPAQVSQMPSLVHMVPEDALETQDLAAVRQAVAAGAKAVTLLISVMPLSCQATSVWQHFGFYHFSSVVRVAVTSDRCINRSSACLRLLAPLNHASARFSDLRSRHVSPGIGASAISTMGGSRILLEQGLVVV